MILDERTEFADAGAIDTTGVGYAVLGDVIDLGAAGELNVPEGAFLHINIDTAVTSDSSATVQFALVSDSTSSTIGDSTATPAVHLLTDAIAKATLVAGYTVVSTPLPRSGNYRRYLGVEARIGTYAVSAGKANAFLTWNPPAQKAFPDASN